LGGREVVWVVERVFLGGCDCCVRRLGGLVRGLGGGGGGLGVDKGTD